MWWFEVALSSLLALLDTVVWATLVHCQYSNDIERVPTARQEKRTGASPRSSTRMEHKNKIGYQMGI